MSLEAVPWRPPTLSTQRLVLRAYERADAEAIYGYASDPQVAAYMSWPAHRSLADAHAFLDGVVTAHYRSEQLDYGLCLRGAERRLIGGLGVYSSGPQHGVAELGYVLARSCWGAGYMPEAARALLDHCFASARFERIFAPIFAENRKSRRAAEKMGLQLEGVLRSSIAYRGRRWDQAIYAALRSEWRSSAAC